MLPYRNPCIFFCIVATALLGREGLIEVESAYYMPTGKDFAAIYGGGAIYGIEASCQLHRGVYGWINGSYFDKGGISLGMATPTHIELIPLTVGLKYVIWFREADLYFGLGALGAYAHVTNNAPYIPTATHWGYGGIVKGGVLIDLSSSFYIDLFSGYSFFDVHFPLRTSFCGGWQMGVGLGIRLGEKTPYYW
jgi:hypothetical protein